MPPRICGRCGRALWRRGLANGVAERDGLPARGAEAPAPASAPCPRAHAESHADDEPEERAGAGEGHRGGFRGGDVSESERRREAERHAGEGEVEGRGRKRRQEPPSPKATGATDQKRRDGPGDGQDNVEHEQRVAHDRAAPEAPGREASPVEDEAGEPDGTVEGGGRADCAALARADGLAHRNPLPTQRLITSIPLLMPCGAVMAAGGREFGTGG